MKHIEQQKEESWSKLTWDAAVVHFSEIGLKGGNRGPFLRRLEKNLRRVLTPLGADVVHYHNRVLLNCERNKLRDVVRAAAQICGVSHVAPVRILPPDIDVLKAQCIETYRTIAKDGDSFAIRFKRSDKRFPLNSMQAQQELGASVVEATNAPVCLKNPVITLQFRAHEKNVYMIGPRVSGPDGLPVGVTGRVLTLFSGGIDSPAAAWLMMKRGCLTDYLHFHVYPDASAIEQTKIPQLIKTIAHPQGLRPRLLLIPYHPFEMGLLAANVPQDMELILFRRFIARVAGALAVENDYDALVTGDNLAQVASQTMENLRAFANA